MTSVDLKCRKCRKFRPDFKQFFYKSIFVFPVFLKVFHFRAKFATFATSLNQLLLLYFLYSIFLFLFFKKKEKIKSKGMNIYILKQYKERKEGNQYLTTSSICFSSSQSIS